MTDLTPFLIAINVRLDEAKALLRAAEVPAARDQILQTIEVLLDEALVFAKAGQLLH